MKEKSENLTNLILVIAFVIASVIWWGALKNIVLFVVTLGILVFIHEWGHFVAARSVGVHCYEFALGFGPKLMTYLRRNGTEYTIRAVPLGGFVNIKGMQPEDPIMPDGLNGKRPAERALVYLAGPLMNVILGVTVLLLSGALIGTYNQKQALIVQIEPKAIAKRLEVVSRNGQAVTGYPKGLRVGDQILQIDGKPIARWDSVYDEINPNPGRQVTLLVRRGADELLLTGKTGRKKLPVDKFLTITRVPPETKLDVRTGDQLSKIDGKPVDEYIQGRESFEEAARRVLTERTGKPITLVVWRNLDQRAEVTGTAGPLDVEMAPGQRYVGVLNISPSPGQGPRVGLAQSLREGKDSIQNFFLRMAAMFSTPKQIGERVGGPVAIFNVLGDVGKLPLLYYFSVLASLSLSLAVFNLFPVPVLDGGHMLILTWEVLRRRRLEPAMQQKVQMVGLAIIAVIFIFIMQKDIRGLLP